MPFLDGVPVGSSSQRSFAQEKHPELRPENFGHTLVADDPFWVRLVSDPRLLKIAADFIGALPLHFLLEPAGNGEPEMTWWWVVSN